MSLVRLDKIGANAHLYSIVLKDDVVNGNVVALKGIADFDRYNSDKVGDIANDRFVFLVEEFLNYLGYENEKDQVLKSGKTVRGYALVKDDVVTITLDAITNTPVVGKFVVPAVGSYVLSAVATTTTENLVFAVEELTTLGGYDAVTLRVIKA